MKKEDKQGLQLVTEDEMAKILRLSLGGMILGRKRGDYPYLLIGRRKPRYEVEAVLKICRERAANATKA